MKFVNFLYRVEIRLTVSREEVDKLVSLANNHYDAFCRSTAASGGFLRGVVNKMEEDASTDCVFSWDDVDTLLKITERETSGLGFALHAEFYNAFNDMKRERRRISKEY